MAGKRVCIKQHLRGRNGADSTIKSFFNLSQSSVQVKYFLRCDGATFEILGESAADCSAIIHATKSFVFLEALRPDVSVDALGYNFDGQSAHLGFQLASSAPDSATIPGLQPMLQLRPGESFHIGSSTFSLVPEEHSDLQASGYKSYTRQVSQVRSASGLASSPMVSSPRTSPLKPAAVDMIPHTRTTLPGDDDTGQRPNMIDSVITAPLPLFDPEGANARENLTPSGSPTEAEDEVEVPNDLPKAKRRKLSPAPAEESQDSLAGKCIRVARVPIQPVTVPETPAIPHHSTPESHPATSPDPQAPDPRNNRTASPEHIEPTSSIRNTRSTVHHDPSPSNLPNGDIRILFTTSSKAGTVSSFAKFLRKKGIQIVDTVPECTVLCIGKELKKTSKLILAIALGKDIVTDSWVIDSAKADTLQDLQSYIPNDPDREAEWGFSLPEAIARGKESVKVFDGWNIAFTASAKREVGKPGLADLKEIATVSRAVILSRVPKKGSDEGVSTLVIGTREDVKPNSTCRYYSRDVIGLSVLRGELDLEGDEFQISKPVEERGGKKRKR